MENMVKFIRHYQRNLLKEPQNVSLGRLTEQLTAWSRVPLEKLIVTQLVKKILTFHRTWRFIAVFTRTRQWSLRWTRWIQPTPSYPISLRSILILSSYLGLRRPSDLFPSGFPTKILYPFLISHTRATCPTTLILLHLITLCPSSNIGHIHTFGVSMSSRTDFTALLTGSHATWS